MGQKYSFTGVIESTDGGGAFVRIPFDVEKAFGKKRVPIKATIEGQPYRGTLVRMGEPFHMLLILKEIRQKAGKQAGDTVSITIEEDLEERRVEIPDDLAFALQADPQAKAAFEKLSYSHQREHVLAILDAKKEETRRRRVIKAIEILKGGHQN